MKIAITGATGFIGGYIVRELAEKGHSLRALVRPQSDRSTLQRIGAEIIRGDILQDDSIQRLVTGADVVVHNMHCQDVKASENPGAYVRTNVCASFWLLEAARRAGCKQFIFTSSGAVYGETFNHIPIDERHPTFPTHIYGAYKVSVEALCGAYHHQFDMNTVCIRPVYVYGLAPKIENSLWADLVEKVMRGEPIKTPRAGNVVSVQTVAEAVALVLGSEAVAGDRINLADCYIEWQTVAEMAKEILGSRTSILKVPRSSTQIVLNDKARRLGVHFRGIEGVRQYLTDLVVRLEEAHAAPMEVTV